VLGAERLADIDKDVGLVCLGIHGGFLLCLDVDWTWSEASSCSHAP
jgi:hypothetical protein